MPRADIQATLERPTRATTTTPEGVSDFNTSRSDPRGGDSSRRPNLPGTTEDHLRLYLRQMPHQLLSREQEVEICQRVEAAEEQMCRHLYRFGTVARAHLRLATRLLSGEERLDHAVATTKVDRGVKGNRLVLTT